MADADPLPMRLPSPFATTDGLRSRLTEAVVSQAGFNHAGLNARLRRDFGGRETAGGALVSDPVIEGAASYLQSATTLGELSGNLLHREVVDALTAGNEGDDYRFDRNLRPYRHQLDSWRILGGEQRRSLLVTSGTGSGKTECFLVPLLDDLAREAESSRSSLTGVRAIMLYPLNALIASQEERLRRWTKPFGDRLRFGLYNGMTPESLREIDRRADFAARPEQVVDRKTMRADPPPILVTNVTMLEYMTIRREDRPLVERSQGSLRWIIIDEAHSYIGSRAAEVALLLRRVLQTFGVEARDVRFVATSATIGGAGEEARNALRSFLADLAGVDPAQVDVVEGTRETVVLPVARRDASLSGQGLGHTALSVNPAVQSLIRAAEAGPLSLREATGLLLPTGSDPVAVLEAIADDRAGPPLLPLRVHNFIRAVPGLWSCLDPQCCGERPADWPFGPLSYERTDVCPHCRAAPVFEVQGCRDCGEPFLNAFDHGDRLGQIASASDDDEFAAARENEVGDDAEDLDEAVPALPGKRRLIGTRAFAGMGHISVVPATGQLPDDRAGGIDIAVTLLSWVGDCPRCHANPAKDVDGPLRSFRYGAPFLIGNAAPVVLDGVPSLPSRDRLLPADGRRLLSFTDSRQGTARFAANIETTAERSHVRAHLYHQVQKSARPDPDRLAETERKREQVEAVETAAALSPILEETARQLRAELDTMTGSAASSVAWPKARTALAADPVINQWIRKVWDEDRDVRFKTDPEAFAQFMMLRELARRPRRANALETLGLLKLQFEAIDRLTEARLPDALRRRGRTLVEWQEFLYHLIDTPLRSYFALNVSWDDVRWLLPRGGVKRNLVGPGEDRRTPGDLTWPVARASGNSSNAVAVLARALEVDASDGSGRADINDVLGASWLALRPLLEGAGSEMALDLDKAAIAPVSAAWLCPVTRRILPRLVFGLSPYGHREHSPFAMLAPEPVTFPSLPSTFPRTVSDHAALSRWLQDSPEVAELRGRGLWRDLHDRAAAFAPYIRAEEHSAQQPPERLRSFEAAFRRGEINLLACSTTMEMGVDIGSVSAVMMTNVPPSIANYRQRVGRAGRRRQGFASALTLARDTPLDRETFKEPVAYLKRQLLPPQVNLDSARIVQRHANALLLARWLGEASGELLKIRTGTFFGLPDSPTLPVDPDAPVARFCSWLNDPSTRQRMADPLRVLVAGTALVGSLRLCGDASAMFAQACAAFEAQWSALRTEAAAAPSDAARTAIAMQLKRMCREHLLKELANRALLPGHGFPTAVVPFITDNRETRMRAVRDDGGESTASRRYDYPTRNADIAIREYAPGAEVVIDGLVWRSAGVTLNWQRPAHEDQAREVQSLRTFWQCRECGAADCSRTHMETCPACNAGSIERRRFLEPAGFRVDWDAPSHADTDLVTYIEPEAARISARGSVWEPLLDPALGRCRASRDGLVFYAAAGASKRGYRICLDCGRAEEHSADGSNPLASHSPLRGSKKGEPSTCSGAGKPFAITEPIALGHETLTDVVEIQPCDLPSLGAAWAIVSALREALARKLGIQTSELGMGVEARIGPLGQATHSLFLFDRNSGGAGFSPRLLDDLPSVLGSARAILDCPVDGCIAGCSACILTADLFAQQAIIDRQAGLLIVDHLLEGMKAPQADDVTVPGAQLSPPIADSLSRRARRGDTVVVYAPDGFDLAAFSAEPFSTLLTHLRAAGVSVVLGLKGSHVGNLNPAQRLGLRDTARLYAMTLATVEPNAFGSILIASLEREGSAAGWFSRDAGAAVIGQRWGVGQVHPVIQGGLSIPPRLLIDEDDLLPRPNTAVRLIPSDSGRSLRLFGGWFSNLIQDELQPLGLWRTGELTSIHYSDRYLRSPLAVTCAIRAFASLRDGLAGRNAPLAIQLSTAPLEPRDGRVPYLLSHDWRWPDDRRDVAVAFARSLHLEASLTETCTQHARQIELGFRDGKIVRLFLDQGFGYWRCVGRDRFDFQASPARQAAYLFDAASMVAGSGSTYIAVQYG